MKLNEAELAQLYKQAAALIYPSLYEGFGIPILEAFEAEVPVITSNTTSMPEVAGDAAILIEPTQVEALADALTQITTNTTLREQLIAKGRIQRAQFSWDKTADLLWQSMVKTLERPI